MKGDKRPKYAIKIDALQRKLMWRFMAHKLNLYLVSDFPKSGGSWVAQMLSEALQVPFPRNKRPKLKSCIMHDHQLYHPSFPKAFCVMRDGRDIMVSAYYHYLFFNDKNHHPTVTKCRSKVPFDDYDDIKKNLPAFIKYMFEEESKGKFHFSWSEFVISWIDTDASILKYEDILTQPVESLREAILYVAGKEVEE